MKNNNELLNVDIMNEKDRIKEVNPSFNHRITINEKHTLTYDSYYGKYVETISIVIDSYPVKVVLKDGCYSADFINDFKNDVTNFLKEN